MTEPTASDVLEEDTKVFISYSRRNREDAARVSDAIKARGFGVFKDTDDILPTEEWKGRLEQLIQEADTIVFLLSPASASSEVCAWEVEYAESLNKRIAPIVIEEVEPALIPPGLAKLNFIFCTSKDPFENAISAISTALNSDIDWIREHTRLLDRAKRWHDGGERAEMLLRGQGIPDAELWRDSRPREAPALTGLHGRFIAESRRAATRRQRTLTGVAIAVSLGTLVLGAFAVLQSIEADEQRARADAERREVLAGQSRFLAGESARRLAGRDHTAAMLIALEGLPDSKMDGSRPVVTEAVSALNNALRAGQSGPVASLGYDAVKGIGVDARTDRMFVRVESYLPWPNGQPGRPGIRLYDPETLNEIYAIDDTDDVAAIAAIPDRRNEGDILVMTSDGEIRRHEVATGKVERVATLPMTDLSVGLLQYTGPDFDQLRLWAVGGSPEGMTVFDVDAGKVTLHTDTELYEEASMGIDATPVLFVYEDFEMKGAWNAATGEMVDAVPPNRGISVAFKSEFFAWAFDGGTVVLHPVPEESDIVKSQFEYSAEVEQMFFALNETALLVRLSDGRVRLSYFEEDTYHDLAAPPAVDTDQIDGFLLFTKDKRDAEPVVDVAVSPDGNYAALARGNTLEIWDLNTLTVHRHIGAIPLLGRLHFSPDSLSVYSAASDQLALQLLTSMGGRFAEDNNETAITRWPVLPFDSLKLDPREGKSEDWNTVYLGDQLVYSPNGAFAFIAYRGAVHVIDLGTRLVAHVLPYEEIVRTGNFGEIQPDLSLSWNDAILVAHYDEKPVAAWSLETLARLETIPEELRLKPSGSRSLSIEEANSVATHFSSTQLARYGTTSINEDQILQLSLSKEGDLAITEQMEGKVRLWQRGVDTPIAEFNLSTNDLAFTPDSSTVIMAIYDAIFFFDLTQDLDASILEAKATVRRCLTFTEREALFLPTLPPEWCFTEKKWPYGADDWQFWQAQGRSPYASDMPLELCRDIACNR